jgi:CheY-like chemotaxis protein
VLVVDDNATNRRILEQMLRNWEMAPKSVASGVEALEALDRAADAEAPFQLVLSDVHMPEMDGFALFESARSKVQHRGIPFVFLTSGARSGDAARCREIGVAAHLTKPVKQSLLMNTIVTAVAGKKSVDVTPAERPDDAVSARPGRMLHILLAEDNAVNQKFAIRAIEKANHKVFVANNGREAVEAWQKQRYDVVLMDVQMPEMDGFEATQKIRQLEGHGDGAPHTPIVAMTANAMKGDKERCLAAGMDGYVSKPVKRQTLFAEIERLLGEL